MESDGLTDCKKCSLFRTCEKIDAVSIVNTFKCIDSQSEYFFRTCFVATSLVTYQYYSYYAVLQCCGEYGVIQDPLLI